MVFPKMVRPFLLTGCALLTLASSHSARAGDAPLALPPARTPTAVTRLANAEVAHRLPLNDPRDFEDARRGFIATIDAGVILNDKGQPVWDMRRFDFLKGDAPASVNPSLWRQAQLNAIHGLFEITDGVYQLRGFDLAVMTVIRGQTGWIVVDPLLSKETSRAALDLLNRELGQRPVTAVLLTHSHPDHFGGVRGVLSDEDVKAKRIPVFAPEGFVEEAVDENLLAGNAMGRRAQFQFASQMTPGPLGPVDSGIGKTISSGAIGFVQPTETISGDVTRRTIDGIEFVFLSARDTEAPAEFMFYLPRFRALHTAEVATSTLHNLLTLRGAPVRDALAWSQRIDDVLRMFGDKTDVVMASHTWPKWGADNIRTYLAHQRDIYRFIHDQTLRLANAGYTMHEIAEKIGEPEFMSGDFSVRGYYGTINHNSKAVYQKYFGWWDGVPANLNPHPPVELAKRYVALAGGAEPMLRNARAAYDAGDYRWVATLMNHLVFAEPGNDAAKSFLAAAYEQLGYQSESAIWRNYYISAAEELRNGPPRKSAIRFANPDFIKATPTAKYLDALAVQVDPAKAPPIQANFLFEDTGEKFGITIEDGVGVQRTTGLFDKPAVTVRLSRADLGAITLGGVSLQSKIRDGSIRVDGDVAALEAFFASHEHPDAWFAVVTP